MTTLNAAEPRISDVVHAEAPRSDYADDPLSWAAH